MRSKRRIGRLGFALSALLAVSTLAGWMAATSAAGAAAGLLDGKIFAGKMGEVGKATGDKDQFIFQGGTFRSRACDAYGFAAAPYTATKNADGTITFTAETESAKEGKMSWKGTVFDDAIDGTVSWVKPGQKAIDYWFKGGRKKK
ncbi:MAG TPA: hypothetical protein VOA87_17380 [Thermoanaerobaculia bacterium]|nr:hypothetical protein [Thermoanaerobaculia bacterium]